MTRELKRYNVMGVRFDVDVRYNVLDVVGQGASLGAPSFLPPPSPDPWRLWRVCPS